MHMNILRSAVAQKKSYRTGFTLIELLIVIALIALVSGILLVNLAGRKSRKTLDSATTQMAALIREAQSRAVSQSGGTSWGVRFNNATTTRAFYALFASSTYNPGNVAARYALPPGIFYTSSTVSPGQVRDIIFSEMTGLTTSSSIGLYSSSAPGTSTLIIISNSGLISF